MTVLGIAAAPPKRFPLPGDKVEVGRAGTLDDHELAGLLQSVLHFMDALVAHVGVLAEGGIGGPGHATALIGIDGEVEQEGPGTAAGLRFLSNVLYNSH
jgi:hypothetical protein